MWGEKKNYGKTYMGIVRSAFLIDEKGKVEQAWPKVSPKDTPDEPAQGPRRRERRCRRRPRCCRTGRRSCSSTRSTALVAGVSAEGRWRLTGDEVFFAGHFPGRPTLPGVLMIEAIAQLGAYAVLTDPDVAPGKLPLFGGVDGARFRRQVGPGDTLELEVELGRMSAAGGKWPGAGPAWGARPPARPSSCSCSSTREPILTSTAPSALSPS